MASKVNECHSVIRKAETWKEENRGLKRRFIEEQLEKARTIRKKKQEAAEAKKVAKAAEEEKGYICTAHDDLKEVCQNLFHYKRRVSATKYCLC